MEVLVNRRIAKVTKRGVGAKSLYSIYHHTSRTSTAKQQLLIQSYNIASCIAAFQRAPPFTNRAVKMGDMGGAFVGDGQNEDEITVFVTGFGVRSRHMRYH